RCVERPAGGPLCTPLGKVCGVELHLPELVESIRQVQSPLVEPYLDRNRCIICSRCAHLHTNVCPCPLDYLSLPLVDAVEEVDRRRAERGQMQCFTSRLHFRGEPDLDRICRTYEGATGTWTGCDWPTRFGASNLNLNGCKAVEAESVAVEAIGRPEAS